MSSKAIYLDGWNEVKNCQECKLIKYADHPRPRYSCADGVSIGGCDIPDGCRLPDWDTVRDHGPGEVPNHKKDVIVKAKISTNIRDVLAYCYIGNWIYSDTGLPLNINDIISWREIL